MTFRVPLLFPSAIVLHRLDIGATKRVNPPGDHEIGYDRTFREPISYEKASTGKVKDTRRYLPEIRIPCQVEVKTFEEIKQQIQGDAPVMNMTFVLHHKNLKFLGLLNDDDVQCVGSTGRQPSLVGIKTNDKITAIEKNGIPGMITQTFKEPLYIIQVQPGSWGMGPLGHDLEILFVNNRPSTDS